MIGRASWRGDAIARSYTELGQTLTHVGGAGLVPARERSHESREPILGENDEWQSRPCPWPPYAPPLTTPRHGEWNRGPPVPGSWLAGCRWATVAATTGVSRAETRDRPLPGESPVDVPG